MHIIVWCLTSVLRNICFTLFHSRLTMSWNMIFELIVYLCYCMKSIPTSKLLNKIGLCLKTTLSSYNYMGNNHIQSQHEGKMTEGNLGPAPNR